MTGESINLVAWQTVNLVEHLQHRTKVVSWEIPGNLF